MINFATTIEWTMVTLHCSLLLYETNEASNSIRFNPRKGTQAHHYTVVLPAERKQVLTKKLTSLV